MSIFFLTCVVCVSIALCLSFFCLVIFLNSILYRRKEGRTVKWKQRNFRRHFSNSIAILLYNSYTQYKARVSIFRFFPRLFILLWYTKCDKKKTYCPRRDIPIQISIYYSSTCVICVCVCCVLCEKQYLLIKYIILWNKESHFFVTLK